MAYICGNVAAVLNKQKPMGTINQGILGNFKGKVGNVVGSTWKGTGVMRIRAASIKNPNTERQQAQRQRFGLVGRFLQAHRYLINIGFKAYSPGITAGNAAMSYNLANAISGEFPEQAVDMTKVQISRGTLAPLTAPEITSSSPATLEVAWSNNSGMSNANETDHLSVSCYDADSGEAVYFLNCASRADGNVTLSLPAEWSGRSLQVLAFFNSLKNPSDTVSREMVSNTGYAGSVVLA